MGTDARAQDPTAGDIADAMTPFSVSGGGTRELVAEYASTLPGIVSEQRAYPVAGEASSSLAAGWVEIPSFDL